MSQGVEAERLQTRNVNLNKIQEALALLGDMINWTLFFNEDIKKDGRLLDQKILTILINYWHKMEATLEEMQKLLPRPVEVGLSQPVSQATTPPPPQSQALLPTFKELKEKIAAFA